MDENIRSCQHKQNYLQQMRINWKCFILIIVLHACKGNEKPISMDNGPALYPLPLTVALDTTNGYTFNPITGDSIKPLRNATGDPVKTGVPVSLIKQTISTKETVRSSILEGVQTIKTIISEFHFFKTCCINNSNR